jgi:hypothetical protein
MTPGRREAAFSLRPIFLRIVGFPSCAEIRNALAFSSVMGAFQQMSWHLSDCRDSHRVVIRNTPSIAHASRTVS